MSLNLNFKKDCLVVTIALEILSQIQHFKSATVQFGRRFEVNEIGIASQVARLARNIGMEFEFEIYNSQRKILSSREVELQDLIAIKEQRKIPMAFLNDEEHKLLNEGHSARYYFSPDKQKLLNWLDRMLELLKNDQVSHPCLNYKKQHEIVLSQITEAKDFNKPTNVELKQTHPIDKLFYPLVIYEFAKDGRIQLIPFRITLKNNDQNFETSFNADVRNLGVDFDVSTGILTIDYKQIDFKTGPKRAPKQVKLLRYLFEDKTKHHSVGDIEDDLSDDHQCLSNGNRWKNVRDRINTKIEKECGISDFLKLDDSSIFINPKYLSKRKLRETKAQNNLILTKSKFVTFLNCPRCLWISSHQPNLVKAQTDYEKFIANQGYEVEDFAKKLIQENTKVHFQIEVFEDNQYIRADILEENDDETFTLYEIKSSGTLTKSKLHDFTHDLAFQMNTLQKAGYKISQVKLISPNPNYIKPDNKPVDPVDYFLTTDLTKEVDSIDIEPLIKSAKETLHAKDKSSIGSDCSLSTSVSPENCKDQLPEFSIYHLLSRSPSKIKELEERSIYAVKDIPSDFDLTSKQTDHVISAKHKSPSLNVELPNFLKANIKYPLYFLDYESINLAIPRYKGHKPFQQIVFQFSLHIQKKQGAPLEHYEFLAEDTEVDPSTQSAEALTELIPPNPKGTFIAWHKSFEAQRNKEMAVLSPQHSQMFEDINNRLFDLKEVFSKNYYVDWRFKGSSSIKNVLPVLCPELSYKELEIQNGTQASLAWYRDFLCSNNKNQKLKQKQSLLEYCKLDTLAMKKILDVLLKDKT